MTIFKSARWLIAVWSAIASFYAVAQVRGLAVEVDLTTPDSAGNKKILSVTSTPSIKNCPPDCEVQVKVSSLPNNYCWAETDVGIVKVSAGWTIRWTIDGDAKYEFADDGLYFLKQENDDVDPSMHFRRRARPNLSTPRLSAWRATHTQSEEIHYTPLVFYMLTVATTTGSAKSPVFCGASDPKIINVP